MMSKINFRFQRNDTSPTHAKGAFRDFKLIFIVSSSFFLSSLSLEIWNYFFTFAAQTISTENIKTISNSVQHDEVPKITARLLVVSSGYHG